MPQWPLPLQHFFLQHFFFLQHLFLQHLGPGEQVPVGVGVGVTVVVLVGVGVPTVPWVSMMRVISPTGLVVKSNWRSHGPADAAQVLDLGQAAVGHVGAVGVLHGRALGGIDAGYLAGLAQILHVEGV